MLDEMDGVAVKVSELKQGAGKGAFQMEIFSFAASDYEVLEFSPCLDKKERKDIHEMGRKYDLTSKSKGKGANRFVSLFKSGFEFSRGSKGPKVVEEAKEYLLPISDKAANLVKQHFQRFPPTPLELQEVRKLDAGRENGVENGAEISSERNSSPEAPANSHSNADKKKSHKKRGTGGGRFSAKFSTEEVEKKWKDLNERRSRPEMAEINRQRSELPVARHRAEILEAIDQNQIVLVSGETGSGKTTQIPQFVVEDCWSRGQACRIMCTQPRRISAITMAERVAQEAGTPVGKDVGYTIRLEAVGGPECSIMYCTNGVLLRKLTHGMELGTEVTHIILDEVHERDSLSDFLLILCRDILPNHPNIKLVLMSATLHIDQFSQYFGGCPVVQVEGKMYEVQDYYLEDVLRVTGFEATANLSRPQMRRPAPQPSASDKERECFENALREAFVKGSDAAFETLAEATDLNDSAKLVNLQHSQTGLTALIAAISHGRLAEVEQYLNKGADPKVKAKNGMDAHAFAQKFKHKEIAELLTAKGEEEDNVRSLAWALQEYSRKADPDEVDLDLIFKLLCFICSEGEWRGHQRREDREGPQGAILIFMPGLDEILQMKRKLEETEFKRTDRYWIIPLHSMIPPSYQRQAFKRPPLGTQKIILATTIAETSITIDDVTVVINPGKIKQQNHDPHSGVSMLRSEWISRANEKQRRGRAGRCQNGVAFHLYSTIMADSMPEFMTPEIKRCSLEDICLQVKVACGDNSVSIADFLSKAPDPPAGDTVERGIEILKEIGALNEDESLTTLGRHLAALPVDVKLGKMLLYGILFRCLDPLLIIACSMSYKDPWIIPIEMGERTAAKNSAVQFGLALGGASDHLSTVQAYYAWKDQNCSVGFLKSNYLSPSSMRMIDGMRDQLMKVLCERGLVDRSAQDVASANARDLGLLRCALTCGLYPLVGCLDSKRRGAFKTRQGKQVTIGSWSVNGKIKLPKIPKGSMTVCPLVAYDSIKRGEGGGLFSRATTAIQPHSLPVVAGKLEIMGKAKWDGGHKVMLCDGWLHFVVREDVVQELALLKFRLEEAFGFKVANPGMRLPDKLFGALQTVSQFFSTDCRVGPSPVIVQNQDNAAHGPQDRSKKHFDHRIPGRHTSPHNRSPHTDRSKKTHPDRRGGPSRNPSVSNGTVPPDRSRKFRFAKRRPR